MVGIWAMNRGNQTVAVKAPVKSKSGMGKGRSLTTYQNKLRKLQSYYNRMVKESEKQKVKKKTPNKKGVYFCDKFSTFDSYKKVLSIKTAK